MIPEEESFPRGGKKPKLSQDRKKFDFLGNSDKIGKKRRYRAKPMKRDDDGEEPEFDYPSDVSSDDDGEIKSISTEILTWKTVQGGMTILGRVSNITDTNVCVSFPGRINGMVYASHISAPYTKQLQRYVNDEIEEVKKLNELFTLGEYVSVYITKTEEIDNKIRIDGSLMPQDVNKGITANNVREGNILRGAIESIEDHGFVIDLGVANCRAFLPKTMTDDDFTLDVGRIIWCVVKKCSRSTSNCIVTVSNKIETIQNACISGNNMQHFSVNDLKPGMAVDFFVNKTIKDGVEGSVLSDSTSYIHFSQIEAKLNTNKRTKAYLLYTMPLTRLPFFTTRNIFATHTQNLEEEFHYKIGQIVDDAKVMKVTNSLIVFKLEHNCAIMARKHSNTDDDRHNAYTVGSEHRIRIINYYASDYACACTDDQSVLDCKYYSLDDFEIGEIVEATVHKIADKGITVKIDRLFGWIPDFHASDVGLYDSNKPGSKHVGIIAKKFHGGQKVSARVLRVKPASNLLHLTAKPTLLSPDLKILHSYKESIVGKQYKGVIVNIMKSSILVTFFGETRAIIREENLSNEKIKDIKSVFNIGQIVNCTILTVNVEEMKIEGSLIHEPSKSKKKAKKLEDIDEMLDSEQVSTKKEKKKKKKNVDEEVDVEEPKKKRKSLEIDDVAIESEVKSKKDKKKNKVNEQINTIEVDNEVLTKKEKKNKKKAEKIDDNSEQIEVVSKKDKKKRKAEQEETAERVKKPKKSTEEPVSFSSMNNFWDLSSTTITKNIMQKTGDSADSDTDSDADKEPVKKKKTKLTLSEKIDKARQEEEKLREIEKQLSVADSQPKSSDQFDRLLLANPNNSELWIAYMAFHLQATEIDRARSVAKKALNSISFREENDKLNIWLAFLNLESRFGTKDSFKTTLQEALQANDTYSVHSKVLDMYAETGKSSDLTSLVDTVMAKYKAKPEIYTAAGRACYKLNLVDKARAVMQKAIARLDAKQHVPILIQFAEMERSNGDTERAETIFEQIISCQPKRLDVWSVYADMLIKSAKFDNARLVLERAVAQKWQPRKMKNLFKKWMNFEEKHGKPDQVEAVREMAAKYVENISSGK